MGGTYIKLPPTPESLHEADVWIYKILLTTSAIHEARNDEALGKIASFLIKPMQEDGYQGRVTASVLEEGVEELLEKFGVDRLRGYLYGLARNVPGRVYDGDLLKFVTVLSTVTEKFKKLNVALAVRGLTRRQIDNHLEEFINRPRDLDQVLPERQEGMRIKTVIKGTDGFTLMGEANS